MCLAHCAQYRAGDSVKRPSSGRLDSNHTGVSQVGYDFLAERTDWFLLEYIRNAV